MALFMTKARREDQRKGAIRSGRVRISGFIRRNEKSMKDYWKLGKKALRMADQPRFERFARGYLSCRQQIARWEKFLLDLDYLEMQKSQMEATTSFLGSIKAISRSMLDGIAPEEVAKLETELDAALSKGETLDAALTELMDYTSERFSNLSVDGDVSFDDLAREMRDEAAKDEGADFDSRISDTLGKIEAEMRKEER